MTQIKKELEYILSDREYTVEQAINKLARALTWANRATLIDLIGKYIEKNYLTSKGGKIAISKGERLKLPTMFETKNLQNESK